MKRLITVLLAALMLAAVLPGGAALTPLEEALQKQQQLVAEAKELNNQLAQYRNSAEKYQAERAQHAERMANYEAQMEQINIIIDYLSEEIARKQQEIDQARRDLTGAVAKFSTRLREGYMNDSGNVLSVLFGADSFSELLSLSEFMRKIEEHDKQSIDNIKELQAKLDEMRKELDVDLLSQENSYKEYQTLRDEVAKLYQEANANLSFAQAQQAVAQADYDEIMAEIDRQSAEIAGLMSTPSEKPFVGGSFGWPVPGFYWISSPYGQRTLYGRPNFHTGIDIAGGGIHGQSVVASNSGVVTTVVYGSTGYGYYVIVDHGGNYKTLYAHMSGINVAVGQEVIKSETIGYVGSTGNSTGPHLHFEIRLDGTALDPVGSQLLGTRAE